MEFFVQQAVLDAGVKIIFPVIRDMDNTVESDEWKAYRTRKLHELSMNSTRSWTYTLTRYWRASTSSTTTRA